MDIICVRIAFLIIIISFAYDLSWYYGVLSCVRLTVQTEVTLFNACPQCTWPTIWYWYSVHHILPKDYIIFCFCFFLPQLKGKDDQPIGKITKQWSGVVKEMLTDTDNFGIQFPIDLDVRVKAVLLGACFLIVSARNLSFLSLLSGWKRLLRAVVKTSSGSWPIVGPKYLHRPM